MIVLPDAVRARVVAFGSDVLGGLAAADVPTALRPVARFTPAKRARLGGSAIATAIESDPAFRRRVLDAASAAVPGLVEALDEGAPPPAADPVDVATIAYLLRPDGWEKLVDQAAESVQRGEDEARQAREAAATLRVREQLDAARAAARDSRERLKAEVDRLKAENTTLRRRLQEARERLGAAQESERSATESARANVEQADTAQRSAEAEARRLRARLAEVEEALESTRRVGREVRGLGTARLSLLLETLTEAAAGLRRELALPASSLLPADTVEAAAPGIAGTGGTRARSSDDPRFLEELLALPRVHVVVDGYNVTKTAWSAMPLDAQRSRLVNGLSALAARTGAEVTCVFDGADVAVPPPVGAPRVRVRFSPEGQTADELIRRLVKAEPEGRPVVVVSSDREVADGVRRAGVRSVEARALVGLLT